MTLLSLARKGRAALCALGLGLGLCAPATQAQSITLPPAELGGLSFSNGDGGRMLVAQADQAQLLVRIQQLEEQLRSLNGQVEGLTFQLTQLQEILNRMQEDTEFRLQALEGGAGGKTEAATQPGGVTQPEALPQAPQTTGEPAVPATDVPAQGVQPLPGEAEIDPSFDDGTLGPSSDPLVGTGSAGAVDLATGQPINLSFDPRAGATDDPDAEAQFTAGYDALVQRDYAFAEDQFSQFLALYPDNARATDAANFLGEALLARRAYDEAAEVLLDAYQKHPEHARAPDLLLKLGMALSGAGERETACRTFAEIGKRYPDTIPAFKSRLTEEQASAQCPPA